MCSVSRDPRLSFQFVNGDKFAFVEFYTPCKLHTRSKSLLLKSYIIILFLKLHLTPKALHCSTLLTLPPPRVWPL